MFPTEMKVPAPPVVDVITAGELARLMGGGRHANEAVAEGFATGLLLRLEVEGMRDAIQSLPVSRTSVTRWLMQAVIPYDRKSALSLWLDGPIPRQSGAGLFGEKP
ncbi:MAG: hypothetical protein RR101_14685 [Burkholderiaceae bacterium]